MASVTINTSDVSPATKTYLSFFLSFLLIFPPAYSALLPISILFPPIGPDSPGEPHEVPHPALPAAAGEAVPGKAWLSGVELALPQPVL